MENENETVGSQMKWLGNIQSELERMKKLVDDLLFLARADAEDEMPKEYFDLSSLYTKFMTSLHPFAKRKAWNFYWTLKTILCFTATNFA